MIKGDVSANSLKSLSGTSLTVTYFPQKGTINITGGSDSQAEMIKDFIKANDKKQPQAYVEMQIVELSENGSKDFQNTWTLLTPFFSGRFDGINGLAPYNNGTQSAPIFFTGGPFSTVTGSTSSVDGNGNTTNTDVVTEYFRYHGKILLHGQLTTLLKMVKADCLLTRKLWLQTEKNLLLT